MDDTTLLLLASRYFESRGYVVERDLKFMGFSGLLYTFNLTLKKERDVRVVFVMDWNKTVGINMIINADRAASDVNLAYPIIVARKFSDHARSYSNKKKITLMTKDDIMFKPSESK
jgi:tRNA splicing endonuclease